MIKNLLLYPGYDASSSCSVPFSPLLVQILLGENVTVCHFISTSFGVSSIQSLLTNCFVLNKLYYEGSCDFSCQFPQCLLRFMSCL